MIITNFWYCAIHESRRLYEASIWAPGSDQYPPSVERYPSFPHLPHQTTVARSFRWNQTGLSSSSSGPVPAILCPVRSEQSLPRLFVSLQALYLPLAHLQDRLAQTRITTTATALLLEVQRRRAYLSDNPPVQVSRPTALINQGEMSLYVFPFER